MGVKTTTKVWEWSQAEGTDRLVMLALADWCDDENECYPGVTKIAKKCRVSERTVQRSFQTLINMGELTIERGAGLTTKTGPTNRFKLNFPRGVNMTPGDIQGTKGVTPETQRGDKAMSPKPSVEPSVEPSEAQSALPLAVESGKKRFTPPSKQEVSEHFKSLGMNGSAEKEAETFVNYYEARGWMMGKVKMQKWKAAATNWKNRQDDRNAPPVAGKDESAYWQDYPTWIASKPPKYAEFKDHRYAPDFIKTEYHKERKAQRARNVRISDERP